MPVSGRGYVLILIHGLGDQQADWSDSFEQALEVELKEKWMPDRVLNAYWANLSVNAAFADVPRLLAENVDMQKFAHQLLTGRSDGVLPLRDVVRAIAAADRDVLMNAKDLTRLVGLLDQLIVDVGNYVTDNAVRTAIQNVLHARLSEATERFPGAAIILASHSQGTMVSYDVLQQAAGSYPSLRIWITMGCPAEKYFTLFRWGDQRIGIPAGRPRWVNLWDSQDIVGRALSTLIPWGNIVDTEVNNHDAPECADAHDHWNNPQVVAAIAAEVSSLL